MIGWDNIIQPKSSYLLTGDVGSGKSALAYYLLEICSQKYNLVPVVVGLPESKRRLLPTNFGFLSDVDEIASKENAIIFIDESDIQLPLDSNKNKEEVIDFLSLPRQRKQILILAYHFPRLVKGTYLPFFSGFLFKQPPYLIEFAAKLGSVEIIRMMQRASIEFDNLPINPAAQVSPGEYAEAIRRNTYVVAPRIRWQGMIENTLCSFWSEELSEIWAGTGIRQDKEELTRGQAMRQLRSQLRKYGMV